jgi:hypothetical protein
MFGWLHCSGAWDGSSHSLHGQEQEEKEEARSLQSPSRVTVGTLALPLGTSP